MQRKSMSKNATPKYFKARPLPYVMRDMVDKELDRLLADDIIEAVQYSDWAAPVVPVMKADKSVRLCGDYKLTVNQVAKLDRYPIPKIEDLYAPHPTRNSTCATPMNKSSYIPTVASMSRSTLLGGYLLTNACPTEYPQRQAFTSE